MNARAWSVIALALVASGLTSKDAMSEETARAQPAPVLAKAPATAKATAPATAKAKLTVSIKPAAKAALATATESPLVDEGAADGVLSSDGDTARAEPAELFQARLPSEPPAPVRAPTERPLALRRTADKPLELLAPSPSSGIGYKLLACCIIIAGAVWLLRRRGIIKPPKLQEAMKIVSRTSIGVRSELMLVNVDGQRLLLGITPGSIARLAVLPPLDAADEEPLVELAPNDAVDNEPGFESALRGARSKVEELAARVRRAARKDDAPRDEPSPRAQFTNDDEVPRERSVRRREERAPQREDTARRRPNLEVRDEEDEIERIRAALRSGLASADDARGRAPARSGRGERVSISVGDEQAASLGRLGRKASGAR
ncbi:MAG: hypothetical protein EXR75_08180 [Myxococcales bacterium]|nr:hypothetical protein [Myxococcales bacterium]